MTTIKDRLDNVLVDWASPKTRRRVHAGLELVFFVAAGYFAVGGDWNEFVGFLLLGGYSGANRANTPLGSVPPAGNGYDDLLIGDEDEVGGA